MTSKTTVLDAVRAHYPNEPDERLEVRYQTAWKLAMMIDGALGDNVHAARLHQDSGRDEGDLLELEVLDDNWLVRIYGTNSPIGDCRLYWSEVTDANDRKAFEAEFKGDEEKLAVFLRASRAERQSMSKHEELYYPTDDPAPFDLFG